MALTKDQMLEKAYQIGLFIKDNKAVCPFGKNGDLREAWEIGKEEAEMDVLTSKILQVK
jgi:hypothetical protein